MRAKVKEAAQSSGRKAKFSQMSTFDKTFTVCGDILLFLFVLCIIVPMVYIVIASFMDPVTLQNKGVTFDLSKWTITAYKRVIENKMIWVGFINSIVYSVVFTAISVIVTLMAAYPMSREDFRGRKFFNVIFIITMFFGGGLIPTYLLISRLGMLDTIWAIVLPNDIVYFFKIMMPVCKPVIMVLVLWQFVGMWNSYFDAMIYLSSESRQPLQLVLRAILIQSQPQPGMVSDIQSTAARAQLAELLKYATIIISSIPLLIMYPFFQKYFDSGVMVGSVKG